MGNFLYDDTIRDITGIGPYFAPLQLLVEGYGIAYHCPDVQIGECLLKLLHGFCNLAPKTHNQITLTYSQTMTNHDTINVGSKMDVNQVSLQMIQ